MGYPTNTGEIVASLLKRVEELEMQVNKTKKPMTVEEMRKAWNDPEELTQQCLIDYCRAIERHHGIGSEDE